MSSNRALEYIQSIPLFTRTLLAINVIVHCLIFLFTVPTHPLAIKPKAILERYEFYRAISSAFVHGSLMHILMNMATLIPLGTSIENQFGSLKLFFITVWTIFGSSVIYVFLVWCYSVATFNPDELTNGAVGYSGVLFCYALVESFHSFETSRSIFGFFSVPTKAYPIILLVVLQFIMPNISFFGHLSGLLFGVIIISKPGIALFMPSNECLLYIEDHISCLYCIAKQPSFSRTKDKELAHPYFSSSGSNNIIISTCAQIGYVFGLICTYTSNILMTLLFIVGCPTERIAASYTHVCNQIAVFYHSIIRDPIINIINRIRGSGSSNNNNSESMNIATTTTTTTATINGRGNRYEMIPRHDDSSNIHNNNNNKDNQIEV